MLLLWCSWLYPAGCATLIDSHAARRPLSLLITHSLNTRSTHPLGDLRTRGTVLDQTSESPCSVPCPSEDTELILVLFFPRSLAHARPQ